MDAEKLALLIPTASLARLSAFEAVRMLNSHGRHWWLTTNLPAKGFFKHTIDQSDILRPDPTRRVKNRTAGSDHDPRREFHDHDVRFHPPHKVDWNGQWLDWHDWIISRLAPDGCTLPHSVVGIARPCARDWSVYRPSSKRRRTLPLARTFTTPAPGGGARSASKHASIMLSALTQWEGQLLVVVMDGSKIALNWIIGFPSFDCPKGTWASPEPNAIRFKANFLRRCA